jgi:2-oxoisovalerate dehydrogenase E1 component alpha subunit
VTDSGVGALDQSVQLVQLLTPEGERVEHPDYAFDPDPATLRSLYRDLVLVRRVDAEATALQRQGELGIWASLLGQEAAQIGSGRALLPQDYVFPKYREHGVAWCRDVDPVTLLGLYRGVNLGGWDPKAHNFHLYTIVIGAQTLHATGYAMGVQRDGAVGTGDEGRDTAVIAYFGDGATAQGDVNEAFVFASVQNAPVVFFCQNNQWAISEPNERQTRIPLYQRARGFGFPGVRVDGNDVLAVHAVTRAALDRARRGEGPTFIEAFTYRMGAHTTSDDPTRYRIAAEVEEWKLKDPIARVKVHLSRSGLADQAFFDEVDREADGLAAHVRTSCLEMPDPDPDEMFAFAYREPHPLVAEERAWFAEYHAGFADAGHAEVHGGAR